MSVATIPTQIVATAQISFSKALVSSFELWIGKLHVPNNRENSLSY